MALGRDELEFAPNRRESTVLGFWRRADGGSLRARTASTRWSVSFWMVTRRGVVGAAFGGESRPLRVGNSIENERCVAG